MDAGKLGKRLLAGLAAASTLVVAWGGHPAHAAAPETDYVKGDFDGDSQFDLIFQSRITDPNGNWPVQIWLMDGLVRRAVATLTPQPAQDFAVVGADDFNLDGKTDLVLQYEKTEEVEIWLLDGTTRVGAPLPTNTDPPGAGWVVRATGDFDHDGYADLLWQDPTGNMQAWLMDRERLREVVIPSPAFPNAVNWQIAASADFDHAGDLDFVWHNLDSGKAVVWSMDGDLVRLSDPLATGFTSPSQPAADGGWRVVAIGKVDGAVAMVWQHIAPSSGEGITSPDTDGQIHIWLMGGGGGGNLTALLENQRLSDPAEPPPGYIIVGPR